MEGKEKKKRGRGRRVVSFFGGKRGSPLIAESFCLNGLKKQKKKIGKKREKTPPNMPLASCEEGGKSHIFVKRARGRRDWPESSSYTAEGKEK